MKKVKEYTLDCCSYEFKKVLLTAICMIVGVVFFGLFTNELVNNQRYWIKTTCKTSGYYRDCPDFDKSKCVLYRHDISDHCKSGTKVIPGKNNPITDDVRNFSAKMLLYFITNPVGKETDCWVMSDCSLSSVIQPTDYDTLSKFFWIQVTGSVILGICMLGTSVYMLVMLYYRHKENNNIENGQQ